MKTRTRFLKSIVKSAQDPQIDLPWTRGAARKSWVIRRQQTPTIARLAARRA